MRRPFRDRIIITAVVVVVIIVMGGVVLLPAAMKSPEVVQITLSDDKTSVSPRSNIRIEFSQEVKPQTVADAVSFEPPVPFDVEPHGDAVVINPVEPLSYETDYRMVVGTEVENLYGKTLLQPSELTFTTVPYVHVVGVQPADTTSNVALDAYLSVEFNTPIVSEEAVDAAAQNPVIANEQPQPLTLHGQGVETFEGVGRWLSPTLFRFYPDSPLDAASTYTATLAMDITSDGSARLVEPYEWHFTTGTPLNISTVPPDGAGEVPLQRAVEVQFASYIDAASAGQLFSLRKVSNGLEVAGEVQAEGDQLRFTPATPLEHGTPYVAELSSGIRTTGGALVNEQAHSWQFTTMDALEVEQVSPSPNTRGVRLDTRRISVRFNHPVVALTTIESQTDLPQPLTITPTLRGEGYWVDSSTFVYSPTSQLAPATTYRVEISETLEDETGGTLTETYTWNFMTVGPQVTQVAPRDEEMFVDPTEPVTLTFNQPMQPPALRDVVNLIQQDTGETVEGRVQVRDRGTVAVFSPTEVLERGMVYRVRVSSQAQAAQGDATLPVDFESSFTVAPEPQLVGTTPADESDFADPAEGVTLSFNTPMDWQSVEENLTIEPEPTEYMTSTGQTSFYIYSSLDAETDYEITLGGEAQDSFGTPLGEDSTIAFNTGSLLPSLSLAGAYQIGSYNAYVPAEVPVVHVNVPQVDYRLYRLDPEQTVTLLTDYEAWDAFSADPSAQLMSDSVSLSGASNQQAVDRLDLGDLEAGLYYLEVAMPVEDFKAATRSTIEAEAAPMDRQIMVVTPYAVTIKRSAEKLFVWTVDMATGEPVESLPLTGLYVTYGDEGEEKQHRRDLGQSDAEGILHIDFTTLNTYAPLYVWSTDGDRFAFASTDWNEGITPWNFALSANYGPHEYVGSVYTDRPIYRPQQTVFMRGVLRQLEDDRYILPESNQQVRLEVKDSGDNTVFSTMLSVSEFGSFHASMALDSAASPGDYRIYVSDPDMDEDEQPLIYGTFTVAEYRKPVFEVDVAPSEPDVVKGEPLDMEIAASYFSGGAVADAEVRWWLMADPLAFSSEVYPRYRFGNADDAVAWYRQEQMAGGGKLLSEGTATTDEDGMLTIKAPTTIEEDGQSYRLTLNVEITDRDGEVVAAEGRANVHAGAFYVGLRPESYVAQVGQPQEVSLLTVDMDQQPVSGQRLDVEIYLREWFSVQEQGADGRMYWTSEFSESLMITRTAVTDEQGRAMITFMPDQGGSYRISAKGRDDSGNLVQSSAFTWAYGGDVFWGVSDNNRIDLIADKDRYKPGDTAKILVTAPYTGMQALMTIERNNVMEHQLLTLQDTTTVFQLGISEDHAPNIYVSMVLIKPATDDMPPDVRVGMVNIPVSAEQKALNISIAPDKETVGPRDDVTYSIRVTDYMSEGVRSELSLALVDKAVLTLADDPNPTLTEAFYEKQPLGVFTAQSLTSLVDRVSLNLEAEGKGGGGGPAAEAMVRQEFADTAFWEPSLITDDDGTAEITIPLPDNLTTWRLTARGLTADTLVGQETNDILATRDLLIRPSLPRFLTVGDQPVIQAVVHNNTSSPINATVTLEADELEVSSPAEQEIRVPANGQELVSWQGEVVSPNDAVFRFGVSGGGQQDQVMVSVPVQRFLTPEVVATAGQVFDEPVIETLDIPAPEGEEVSAEDGEIKLELVPSLAAGVESGLGYLEDFAYACTEQTVSRFLPNAVMFQVYQQIGFDDEPMRASLERNLTQGLQRLYTMQHLDGGWGWWTNDDSHPYITAYVVQGLLEARKAGYVVNEQVLDDALGFLEESLNQEEGEALASDTRAYILYVFAEAGQPDRGRTVALYGRRATLSLDARAYLLMTIQQFGDEPEMVQTIVSEFMSRALMNTTSAHWEEESQNYRTMNSDLRTTALVLQALLRADPQNYLIPNAVRYLMQMRDDGHWGTTQETAFSLMALGNYLEQSGELEADYTYRAMLNGQTLSDGAIDRENLATPIMVAVALADALQQETEDGSRLTIEKEGTGQLYYTLRMRYQHRAQEVEPLDQGIGVQRTYIEVDPSTLLPTGTPVSEVASGDLVQVQLMLDIPTAMHYFTVEDMLPAGLEALDSSLKTVTDMAEEPSLQQVDRDESKPAWWYLYFVETSVHDNRVALFATDLPAGKYHYTYLARASTPGTYQSLPARAYQMYAPEVFGRSGGAQLIVQQP